MKSDWIPSSWKRSAGEVDLVSVLFVMPNNAISPFSVVQPAVNIEADSGSHWPMLH